MNTDENFSTLNYYSPVYIQIEVKGTLDKNLTDYLGGLNISWLTCRNEFKISRLEGEISDQSSLMGILNSLYTMRFPIINVMVKQ